MFLDEIKLKELIATTKKPTHQEFDQILKKALELKRLSDIEIATLLHVDDEEMLEKMLLVAGEIKYNLYKNRLVIFAPLYISDYCKNNCTYCGYKRDNEFARRRLTDDEITKEVKVLEAMGHKRLALEVGEDEYNFSFDDMLHAIDVIYAAGDIRRININCAATTLENYQKLSQKDIGTYILFQETYDKKQYEQVHSGGLKGNYERQLNAHHLAMEAGIGDVGGGVLYGLSDYKFDTLALITHNYDLDEKFGAGFHTVSVPRLKNAEGFDASAYNLINDFDFKKIVATLRIAIPYAGIILSTREDEAMHDVLIKSGISQVSAGSQTAVGGYEETDSTTQFDIADNRTPLDVIKGLLKIGYMPSYCTSCYRSGRVGQDFMDIVKAGKIGDICAPNALITFVEFVADYGDDELIALAKPVIEQELKELKNDALRKKVSEMIIKIEQGARDLYV